MAAGATWDDIFGAAPANLFAIAETLRARIREADPATCEVAYPGYNSVNYGVGPKKNTEGYAYLMLQKERINLGFYHGADLPDPANLLEGTGALLRHVKVGNKELAESPETGTLIAAAVAERRRALGK